jgi:hypothetical protein
MESRMCLVPGPVRSLLVGFYGWVVTAYFGAVLLDTVYANAIRHVLDPSEAATIFSKASDFLLLVVAITALAALGAIGSSWQSTRVRNLFVASVLLVMADPLVPIVFRPLLLESDAGRWVRLLLSASASVLGLLGLQRFYRRS